MKLNDLFEDDSEMSYYNPESDTVNLISKDDQMKPKLTLRMVNKLKNMRRVRDEELDKKKEFLSIMYKPKSEEPTM
jgi:hypothetical protein